MRRSVLIRGACGILAAGLTLGSTSASAGLFDFLFGRQEPTYYRPSYNDPINVKVRPKKDRRNETRRPDSGRLMTVNVAPDEARPPRVTPINPEAMPDWHLKDTTLRAGDILILKSGPVVFEGYSRAGHVPSEFTSLDQTRRVSPANQREIQKMVSGVAVLPTKNTVMPQQTPVKRSGRRQAYR